MFTLRFIKHGGNGYRSFAATEYEVNPPEDKDGVVTVDMTVDGETVTEYLHDTEPFDIAYVTNMEGKTIDCIRHANSAHRPKKAG
jgi:hypothetical protein